MTATNLPEIMARLAAAPCPNCDGGKRLGSDQPRYSPDCDRCNGTGALLPGLREPCPSDGASWHPSKAISCPCGGIGWRPKAPDAVLVVNELRRAGFGVTVDAQPSMIIVRVDHRLFKELCSDGVGAVEVHTNSVSDDCDPTIQGVPGGEGMTCMRRFPIHGDHGRIGYPDYRGPGTVDWHLAEEAYVEYARRYGKSQSLERLGERGGFGWSEIENLLKDGRDRRALPSPEPGHGA